MATSVDLAPISNRLASIYDGRAAYRRQIIEVLEDTSMPYCSPSFSAFVVAELARCRLWPKSHNTSLNPRFQPPPSQKPRSSAKVGIIPPHFGKATCYGFPSLAKGV